MSSLVRNWRELFGRVTPEPESPAVGDVTLEARDITVERGGRHILEGVSIEVRAGEVVVLVGPNGAGKSTLLAALAGDQPVIAGRVDVEGTDLTQWSPIDMARRRAVLPKNTPSDFRSALARSFAWDVRPGPELAEQTATALLSLRR
ncbi:hypothetical protein GCM10020255_083150 [Rhodococcus baikonurensis]